MSYFTLGEYIIDFLHNQTHTNYKDKYTFKQLIRI